MLWNAAFVRSPALDAFNEGHRSIEAELETVHPEPQPLNKSAWLRNRHELITTTSQKCEAVPRRARLEGS
jgi:hypothetical protein